MTLGTTFLFKKMSKSTENRLKEFLNSLMGKGLQEWSHTNDSNSWSTWFDGRPQFRVARAKIEKIPGVSLYYSKPDHLKEVSDAIEDFEYFKAFTLCVSLYESLGKNILIEHFERRFNLNSKGLDRLGIQTVIMMLFTQRLIKEETYFDMISVNRTRNKFIHRYMSSRESDKDADKVRENTPKIMSSLRKLKAINDKLTKRKLDKKIIARIHMH